MAKIRVDLPKESPLGAWRKALNKLIKVYGPDIPMIMSWDSKGPYLYLEVPVTRNGRYYPAGVLKKALKEYKQFGSVNHGVSIKEL